MSLSGSAIGHGIGRLQPVARKNISLPVPGMPEHQLAFGGATDDSFGDSGADDHFWGGTGADVLAGGVGDDVLTGGQGDDLLSGGEGMDHLHGSEGNDTLYGGAMGDALSGGPGDDYLDEGGGHSGVDGGEGDDTLVGGLGPDAFLVRRGSGDDVVLDFTAGPGAHDHLALEDLRWADLSFEDGVGGVRVIWEGGSVLLANVQMADLSQDDFMFFDAPDLPPGLSAPDGPTEEAPTPSVPGPLASGALPPEDSNIAPGDQILFDHVSAILGTAHRDVLRGGTTWDQIFGAEGNDHLAGRGGDDALFGGPGDDVLSGGAEGDLLSGDSGNDRLFGNAGNDELMGGLGDDWLIEGSGHGMLSGGAGNDVLLGGAGSDAFMVDPDSGHDVILDFQATGLAEGMFDHIAFTDIEADQVSVRQAARGTLVSWDVGTDGAADGSVLLVGVAMGDLRQNEFMFETPQFVTGVSDAGSWYIFA